MVIEERTSAGIPRTHPPLRITTVEEEAERSKEYLIADLFCGAGGTSTGAMHAVTELDGRVKLVAVNHWPVAVETHQLNHPYARHYIEDLDGANPSILVPEGYLDLLLASPECIHFSRARGGKPMSEQGRMNPWIVHRWLTSLNVARVLVENVPEFTSWGPLDENGRPDKDRKGLYFEEWVRSMWGLGYEVQWRTMNAADFGDATTRVRFFLQARNDGRPIRWPEPTHAKSSDGSMLEKLPRWRGAREIIDWTDTGRSLIDDPKYRKKPLSVSTRKRIARGLQRFGGPLAPYYIQLLNLPEEIVPPVSEDAAAPAVPFHGSDRNNTAPRGMEEPIPTVTTLTGGGCYMVQPIAQPFVQGNRRVNAPRSLDDPIPTATTAHGGGMFLLTPTADPFLLGQQSAATPRLTEEPIPTVSAAGAIALVQPMVVEYYGKGEARSVDSPLSTATTKARHALAQPTIEPVECPARNGGHNGNGSDAPAVHACIVPNFGENGDQKPRVHDVDSPTPTVTSRGAGCLAVPTVSEIGEEGIEDLDPRRVVIINGHPYLLDIRYRMLQNPELARAMGFTNDEREYEFVGNKTEVTKQIGNAVPVNTAAALVKAMLAPAA